MAGVGDGVVAVALPLLAAGLTRDPLAIAAVVAAQHVPWALVHVGWRWVRTDRRTVIGTVDTVRALVLGGLGFLALIGHETLLDIQLVAFVVGLGEALTDGTETETEDVTGLSYRGMLGMAVIGLPLGGVLYEIYPATPFIFEVLAFAVAALLALLVGRPVVPEPVPQDEPPPGPARLPNTRAMTLAAALMGLATSAVVGVLVLFALDDLGLGAPAFGGLLAGIAVCTAVGGFVAPEIGAAFGVKVGLVLALLVAAAGHVVAGQVADPERPLLSAMGLGVAAAAGMIATILGRAQLQRCAGRPLRGEALQRFHLVVWSAIPVGALAGGWIARHRSVHEVLAWAGGAWVLAAVTSLFARPPRSDA
jgi:hypothetical protein